MKKSGGKSSAESRSEIATNPRKCAPQSRAVASARNASRPVESGLVEGVAAERDRHESDGGRAVVPPLQEQERSERPRRRERDRREAAPVGVGDGEQDAPDQATAAGPDENCDQDGRDAVGHRVGLRRGLRIARQERGRRDQNESRDGQSDDAEESDGAAEGPPRDPCIGLLTAHIAIYLSA